MKKYRFNEGEEALVNKIKTAEALIPSYEELEMHHLEASESNSGVGGWYGWKYNKHLCRAIPINHEYCIKPIISDEEVDNQDINMDNVLEFVGCYKS